MRKMLSVHKDMANNSTTNSELAKGEWRWKVAEVLRPPPGRTGVWGCCTFNSLPWFNVQLLSPTTDDIAARVCNADGVKIKMRFFSRLIVTEQVGPFIHVSGHMFSFYFSLHRFSTNNCYAGQTITRGIWEGELEHDHLMYCVDKLGYSLNAEDSRDFSVVWLSMLNI